MLPRVLLRRVLGAGAQVAGTSGRDDVTLVKAGKPLASIVVAPGLSKDSWEARAGTDLQKYLEMMTGGKLPIVETIGQGPQIIVGSAAPDDVVLLCVRPVEQPQVWPSPMNAVAALGVADDFAVAALLAGRVEDPWRRGNGTLVVSTRWLLPHEPSTCDLPGSGDW